MGPDCGTAIVGGVPLGFANEVRAGDIGLIGASGTGLQQVSSLIDGWGAGVSQVIGVGSHDLGAAVGAISMLDALDALAADPATKVLGLVSKPPDPEVAERVLGRAAASGKPVVAAFLGADPDGAPGRRDDGRDARGGRAPARRRVDRRRGARGRRRPGRHRAARRAPPAARPLRRRHVRLRGEPAARAAPGRDDATTPRRRAPIARPRCPTRTSSSTSATTASPSGARTR